MNKRTNLGFTQVCRFENPLRKISLPRQCRDCPESVALGAGVVAAAPPRESLRISSSSMLCCHGAPRIAHTDPGEVPSAQRPWSGVRRTRRCLRCFPLSHIPAWKRNNKIAPFFDFKNWCYFLPLRHSAISKPARGSSGALFRGYRSAPRSQAETQYTIKCNPEYLQQNSPRHAQETPHTIHLP